jgi:hypothetical protein
LNKKTNEKLESAPIPKVFSIPRRHRAPLPGTIYILLLTKQEDVSFVSTLTVQELKTVN